MSYKELTTFIIEYITARRQKKLAEFDKAAAEATDKTALAQERHDLAIRYEPRNWLTDAANRAGQISLVTHAAKFTHSDSQGSSIYRETTHSEGYLGTAALANPTSDAVGNAAALDIAKLLQTEVAGDTLLACLQRQDYRPFADLAENAAQLAQWVAGFSRVFSAGPPMSHKLAKQIFFPVDSGYHLLSPLFSSALAQALHQKLMQLRVSEESKTIRQARKNRQWHEQPLLFFPNTAVMCFGGTKPQNISALNSSRGGRTWLLSARPPLWQQQNKPPNGQTSLLARGGAFDRAANDTVRKLIYLLVVTEEQRNVRIRRQRDSYIDELIDALFTLAADIQRQEWQGWTRQNCRLCQHQQYWLDPWRCQEDADFRQERAKDEWQEKVAEDFARWLNSRMRKALPGVGKTEMREWKTRPRFRQRLRDMEHMIKEALT